MNATNRKVPLARAAELVGVPRPTLYRYALSGKLTTTTSADGVKLVDLDELARVFPDFKPEPDETTEITQLMEEVRNEIALSRQDVERQKLHEAAMLEAAKDLITTQAILRVQAHESDKAMAASTRVMTIIVAILTILVLAMVAKSLGFF